MAIDPLLTLYEKYIHIPGLCQAYGCAGDIGAAIKNSSGRKILSRLFELCRRAPCLTPQALQMCWHSGVYHSE